MRVDVCGLRKDGKVPTMLVLVHRPDNGDRGSSFYRPPGADMVLTPEEADGDRVGRVEVLHFDSLSMTNEPVRTTTKEALWMAERAGVLRPFDSNLRPLLWKLLDEVREQIFCGPAHCDILKISDNEIQWLTGKGNFTEGVKELKKNYDIKLACVSMGRNGNRTYYGNCTVEVPGFIREDIIETTGTGGAFYGCVPHFILEYGLDSLSEVWPGETLRSTNTAASVTTTRKGVLKMMSEVEEIKRIINR